jgi:two-component system response regulator YesN
MFDTRARRHGHTEVSDQALSGLPWELERMALERLGRLDLTGCRQQLRKVTEHLAKNGPVPDREEALFLFDILGQIHRFLLRAPGNGEDETTRRALMLRALSQADDPPALHRAFHEQVESLLAPFERGAASLNPVVERARAYIEENCIRKLSLRQIAGHVTVSRNYLSTLFRKQCGCTITEYIHRVRMQRAELLLLAGGHTISEVAYMVGYQNYRDFYRNFVKYTNTSPKRFRQSLGQLSSPADPHLATTSREQAARKRPRS